MALSEDRIFTRKTVLRLLKGIKGKTLGEIDRSGQFARTEKNQKITGIAGDVIEQSVFGYHRDSRQECDIEIDGILTELKTTGVRIPKRDRLRVIGKSGSAYNAFLRAKEGLSITAVTFEPTIQTDFLTSHFWAKAEHLLLVMYDYQAYGVASAADYARFPIVDYCFNTFSEEERAKLKSDWEMVRDYLREVYDTYPSIPERYSHLAGFTRRLRPNLLLIELVPGFKQTATGGFQKPRYRLKRSFVDHIVRSHFNGQRAKQETTLEEPFANFAQLDDKCRRLTSMYRGKTLADLKLLLNIEKETKDLPAHCVLRMFGVKKGRLNRIADFTKTGIIAKTVTVTSLGGRTEDMKLQIVDFAEWTDQDIDFTDSQIYNYFHEHSFLCPIFCRQKDGQTTFEGFKRFAFEDAFIENEVARTWHDTRALIHHNQLRWEYLCSRDGHVRTNANGSPMGAPNLPKSATHVVFMRGGASISNDESRTEVVNGIRMLPQFLWLKGSFIVNKLHQTPFI